MNRGIVVLVTCGSAIEATKLGTVLVRKRLAACVNVPMSPVSSIYQWKGRVESAKEHLLLIKTSRKCFPALEKEIQRLHSYELPEIIALPIANGSKAYLKWLGDAVGASPSKRTRK